jgi:hypothetical protein
MITQTVAELLEEKVTLDLEGIDRLYLNAYQPMLQTGGGVNAFFRQHRGATVASTVLMAPMSRDFVNQIRRFAEAEVLDIVRFEKGERKDDITQDRLKRCQFDEGVLYIGVAQEKFSTFRVTKQINAETGQPFPWLSRSSVMCNQYYFYLLDEDFGPMFIKFSSYFPYTARICLNGHEYVKRQLAKRGIEYTALDNGLLNCAAPKRAQQILDRLDEKKIDRVVRKWFARLPHPFTPQDRRAGFRYELSILQAEFARTQVFDRPVSGRYFFEEVIRENLDLGRPSQVSLIFNRRITKRTPGKFRTRVVTEGVMPSLHVSYKWSKIKQYFKEDKALRTETTINNPRDFGIGKRLENLPALREIGFQANRRLLDVQKVSQNCQAGVDEFEGMNQRCEVDGQIAAALKFGDPRVMALLQSIILFFLLPQGFTNALLREQVARLMGKEPDSYRPGQMSYDLRRLRLHGLIERIPHSQRYQATAKGVQISLFYTKVHGRVLRGGLSQLFDDLDCECNRQLVMAMKKVDAAIEAHVETAKLAA